MHVMKRILVVAVGLAIAGLGVATSRWGIPVARAEAPQRWEYRCNVHRGGSFFSDDDERDANRQLNDAGKDGWELVSVAGAGPRQDFIFCMKRPAR